MNKIDGFRLPRYKEIPAVGLYLDQTVKYINSFLQPLGCMEITSSMVSNYVKQGLVNKPVGKLYYVDQIAHLIFITIAKSVLSMEHIALLFTYQQRVYTDQIAYDYFCSELENMLYFIFGLKDNVENIGNTASMEKEVLRSLIIAVANIIYLSHGFERLKENE